MITTTEKIMFFVFWTLQLFVLLSLGLEVQKIREQKALPPTVAINGASLYEGVEYHSRVVKWQIKHAEASLRKAKVDFADAKDDFERFSHLNKAKACAEREYMTSKFRYNQAILAVELADLRIKELQELLNVAEENEKNEKAKK